MTKPDLDALDQAAKAAEKSRHSLELKYQAAQAKADKIGDEMAEAQKAADAAKRAYFAAGLAALEPEQVVEAPQKLELAQ